jgi:hypothetical protein
VTGQEQVYTVDPDGADEHLVADNSQVCQSSPEGTSITLFGELGEMRFNVDNGSSVDLGLPGNLYPDLQLFCGVWSPNGARLACEGCGQTDPSLNGVYTLRATDGGDLQRVTYEPNGDDCPSDYSPNGKNLVVTRASDTSYGLWVVKAKGTGMRQIVSGTDFDFCSGSWSPQGNEILFSAHVPDPDRSTILGRPLGRQRAAEDPGTWLRGSTFQPGLDRCSGPSWSPGGRKLMFDRHFLIPNDHFDLYTVSGDGSGLFQVTNTPDLQEGGADWGTRSRHNACTDCAAGSLLPRSRRLRASTSASFVRRRSACSLMRQRLIPRSSRTRPPQAPAGARESPQGHGRRALLSP